jgi:hypothetical protein
MQAGRQAGSEAYRLTGSEAVERINLTSHKVFLFGKNALNERKITATNP